MPLSFPLDLGRYWYGYPNPQVWDASTLVPSKLISSHSLLLSPASPSESPMETEPRPSSLPKGAFCVILQI